MPTPEQPAVTRISLSAVEQTLVGLAFERREPAMRAFQQAVAPVIEAHADEISDKDATLEFVHEGGVISLVAPSQALALA